MSEEDIKRIEKKIDMLYKIVCGIGGYEVINPICDDDYLDELVPLLNISIDTNLFEEYEKVVKLLMIEFKKGEEMKNKLDKLENDYETGNFLKKEGDKMQKMIRNQNGKYRALNKMAESFQRNINDKKEFRRRFLWLNMKEKLGVISSEDYIKHKKLLEEEFEGAIDWMQEELKEYKKL